MIVRESVMLGGKPLTIETGRLAKQAESAILITYGETQVLVSLCFGEPRFPTNFLPLTCDFIEKTYAAGKIPGGFFKREARQRASEIISSRLIDRPCRPLFAEGYRKDTQIVATVMSADGENRADVLAMTGASAALHLSSLPWDGPIVGVRVGRVEGEMVINPTEAQSADSDIDIIVACSRDAIVMVEGGGLEISEAELADALEFAHQQAQPVLELIEEMRSVVGKEKLVFEAPKLEESIKKRVPGIVDAKILEACQIKDKHARYDRYSAIKKELVATFTEELGEEGVAEHEKLIKGEFEDRKYNVVRELVLGETRRMDGRKYDEIRAISTEATTLLRAHGSAMFQRGETQAIASTTLGTTTDEQKIDGLTDQYWKRFFLHYNFPPFCTGEVKFLRGPSRREIGHGALAERALEKVIPSKDEFPYTIRVVSETLESNGSSSMAAVCGGCMSLMDAGVPIKAPVAGIAMGLISDGKRHAVLSDILGDEDHLGDMDFKVCGTEKGITAIQMDIKIKGLSRDLMLEALEQAREGRLHILKKMAETLPAPRPELSKYAPRIHTIKVKPEQIRIIIGPGGKTIKGIVDQTGASINVEDDGTVNIASADADGLRRAIDIVEGLTAEPEIGRIYDGVVRRVADFGAFVEILPNWDGLVHISELAWGRTDKVQDVCKEGDALQVKVLSVDNDGKVRLSHKDTLEKPEGYEEPSEEDRARRPRRDRGDRDRGGRDRDRGGRGRDRDRGGRDRDRGGRSRDRDDDKGKGRIHTQDRPASDRDGDGDGDDGGGSGGGGGGGEGGDGGDDGGEPRRRRRGRRRSTSTEGDGGESSGESKGRDDDDDDRSRRRR